MNPELFQASKRMCTLGNQIIMAKFLEEPQKTKELKDIVKKCIEEENIEDAFRAAILLPKQQKIQKVTKIISMCLKRGVKYEEDHPYLFQTLDMVEFLPELLRTMELKKFFKHLWKKYLISTIYWKLYFILLR